MAASNSPPAALQSNLNIKHQEVSLRSKISDLRTVVSVNTSLTGSVDSWLLDWTPCCPQKNALFQMWPPTVRRQYSHVHLFKVDSWFSTIDKDDTIRIYYLYTSTRNTGHFCKMFAPAMELVVDSWSLSPQLPRKSSVKNATNWKAWIHVLSIFNHR